MAYVVDFTKDPDSLVLGLINDNNPSANLTKNEVDLLDPIAITTHPGYDTQLPVRWKTTGDMVGTVNVYYNRIDLAVLFSLTGISLKEVNLDIDENHNVILNDKFYTELTRRYGVVFTPNDFEFAGVDGNFTLSAKALNRAYKGNLAAVIERSLFSRVRDPILDGFDLLDPSSIELFLTYRNLPIFAFPSRISTAKTSAELVTYGIDCTDFQSFLAINNTTGAFTDFTNLQAQLDAYYIPHFTAPGVGNPAKLYATADYPGANTVYEHVVVIENVTSATMAGKVMLHFNQAI